MSDRFKGCVVVFDMNLKDEDAEPLLSAIRQLKGVLKVDASISKPFDDWAAEERVRARLEQQIFEILRRKDK